MHPQPELPNMGTWRHTWVLGGLNGMQRGPLLVFKISDEWTGRSFCPMSIRFWCSICLEAVSATKLWMPAICWAVGDTPAVKATANSSRASAVREGERVPPLLIVDIRHRCGVVYSQVSSHKRSNLAGLQISCILIWIPRILMWISCILIKCLPPC